MLLFWKRNLLTKSWVSTTRFCSGNPFFRNVKSSCFGGYDFVGFARFRFSLILLLSLLLSLLLLLFMLLLLLLFCWCCCFVDVVVFAVVVCCCFCCCLLLIVVDVVVVLLFLLLMLLFLLLFAPERPEGEKNVNKKCFFFLPFSFLTFSHFLPLSFSFSFCLLLYLFLSFFLFSFFLYHPSFVLPFFISCFISFSSFLLAFFFSSFFFLSLFFLCPPFLLEAEEGRGRKNREQQEEDSNKINKTKKKETSPKTMCIRPQNHQNSCLAFPCFSGFFGWSWGQNWQFWVATKTLLFLQEGGQRRSKVTTFHVRWWRLIYKKTLFLRNWAWRGSKVNIRRSKVTTT